MKMFAFQKLSGADTYQTDPEDICISQTSSGRNDKEPDTVQ